MNVHTMSARPAGRFTAQARPDWPDAPQTRDPETMHPRAVEMAERLREGTNTFKGLIGAGFTSSEITEHFRDAEALAMSAMTRQVSPGADLFSELVAKAKAAIASSRPMPKGTAETQALLVAWDAYCRARAAFVLDPWGSQRERCLMLLRGYFRQTPLGEPLTGHLVARVAEAMGTRH